MLIDRPALQNLRRRLPGPVRFGAQLLYGLVSPDLHYGPEYRRWRRLLSSSEGCSAHEHARWQEIQVADLLAHCFRNVPFYREWLQLTGHRAEDFQTLEDLRRLPTVGKVEIQENLNRFVARNYRRSALRYATTGGSTGIPFGFFNSAAMAAREAAFVSHIWGEHGYRPWKDRCAVLRGVFVRGPWGENYYYNPFRRELHLSSYALTEANALAYVERTRNFRTFYLQAYPSAVSLWAQYLDGQPLARGLFRTIFTASENLYPAQRRQIERVFDCRVVDFYGQAEHVAMARQCEASTKYHFFPQYGIVEFLDPSGDTVVQPGRIAELVATGFLNRATPMVRYRTGDLVVTATGPCPCGRNYPLVERIEGRLQELLVTPDGRRVSMTAINMHNDLFDRVRQFQFEQDRPDRVMLKIVPRPGYSDADTTRIGAEVGTKIGTTVRLYIEMRDQIPPGPGGKHCFLIQRLPLSRSGQQWD